MTTERTRRYAEAIVALAAAEEALDTVEDQLLGVARAIDANEELRRHLTDIHLPVAQKLKLLESDLLQATHPATRSALALVIAAERVSELAGIADEVAQRAATSREEELAEVYVAFPLDDARRDALQAALERATGKKLDLKVYVDRNVVGGVRAKVGDTVYDGSLARRLTDLRTRVGG